MTLRELVLPRQRVRSKSATQSVGRVREQAIALRHASDGELQHQFEDLRCNNLDRVSEHGHTTTKLALAVESIRRHVGFDVYDVQILTALHLASGAIAEMATGEGKTVASALSAVAQGCDGHGVHVVTPNAYLARRDLEMFQPCFEALGLSSGLVPEQVTAQEKKPAYDADVTYGSAYEFGFDYLRDQVVARFQSSSKLGETMREQLRGHDSTVQTIQRGHYAAIVDEADNVLLDEAGSPLVLAEPSDEKAIDGDAHQLAKQLAADLIEDVDFSFSGGTFELTSQGLQRIHELNDNSAFKNLLRPWSEYVNQAIQADRLFHQDVHYVVVDDKIQIVDASTGRIFEDRTWRDGLHQAIEAKAGVPITAGTKAIAQITRQRYFRRYENLCGMTGTAAGCEREFQTVYERKVHPIPLRVPSRRVYIPLRFFVSTATKHHAICEEIKRIHHTGQPILVGSSSILESQQIAQQLQGRVPFQLLNGRQDAEEAEIVAKAGELGTVTIATNLAGRGTDISINDAVRALGGLHVIACQPQDSSRMDRQLMGRCARQGDPGSCQMFACLEDPLIVNFGAWIGNPSSRFADKSGEIGIDVTRQIKRMQRHSERRQFAARAALLRQDLARDAVFLRPCN